MRSLIFILMCFISTQSFAQLWGMAFNRIDTTFVFKNKYGLELYEVKYFYQGEVYERGALYKYKGSDTPFEFEIVDRYNPKVKVWEQREHCSDSFFFNKHKNIRKFPKEAKIKHGIEVWYPNKTFLVSLDELKPMEAYYIMRPYELNKIYFEYYINNTDTTTPYWRDAGRYRYAKQLEELEEQRKQRNKNEKNSNY